MSCLIKVNSNTIELTVHTSCYCISDLLCVTALMCHTQQTNYGNMEQKNEGNWSNIHGFMGSHEGAVSLTVTAELIWRYYFFMASGVIVIP